MRPIADETGARVPVTQAEMSHHHHRRTPLSTRHGPQQTVILVDQIATRLMLFGAVAKGPVDMMHKPQKVTQLLMTYCLHVESQHQRWKQQK